MLIIDLHSSMDRLIRHVMAMYLPTQSVIRGDITIVDLDNQLSDVALNLGTEARTVLTSIEEDVAPENIAQFYG